MIELLKKIQIEINTIDNELAKEDKTLDFYNNFFRENNCTTLEKAATIDKCNLLIALVLRNNPYLSYEEVSDAIYAIRTIPEKFDAQTTAELLNTLDQFELFDNHNEVIDSLTTKRSFTLVDLFKKGGPLIAAMLKLSEALGTTPEDFAKFLKLYYKEKDKIAESLATVMVLQEVLEDKELHQQMLSFVGEDLGIKIKDKQKQKLISKKIQDDYKTNIIMQPIREAEAYAKSLEQKERTRKRNLSKEKSMYEQLEKTLYEALQGGEIRNASSLVGKIENSKIKLQALKVIYQHNAKVYQNLLKEYQTLAANDSSHYQILLEKYGISPETYDVGTIMSNSIEEVELILKQLTKLSITNPDDLVFLLQTTTLESANNITSLIERGIITTNLIFTCADILNPTSKEYEDFMRNLSLLQTKKINPHYLSASELVFITPHQNLQENINTLEEYNLIQFMRTNLNCSFLSQSTLAPAIDTLIELGYEKNLEESLELLNYKDRFNRLKVLKTLNIPLTTTDELIEVLTTEKFFIPDNAIENYIYNVVDYNLPKTIALLKEPKKKKADIASLTEFESTERAYSFDGVIISKNKVARNLSMVASTRNKIDRLLYGIVKDSTLTDEEITKIQKSLTQKKSNSPVKQKL